MLFEFIKPPSAVLAEQERETAEQREKIRAANPGRFELFERFYTLEKQDALLTLELQDLARDLYEDWFNIEDVYSRFGEDVYRQFISDAEQCLASRERMAAALKIRLSEIGSDRLHMYLDMNKEMSAESGYSALSRVVFSQGFQRLDTCPAQVVQNISDEVSRINIAAIEQWHAARTLAKEKVERARLRQEKDRILGGYQKMRGKPWQAVIALCQRMGVIEGTPGSNVFLSRVAAEDLVRLEKNYFTLEKRLRDYGSDIWSASSEDLEVVLDEMFDK